MQNFAAICQHGVDLHFVDVMCHNSHIFIIFSHCSAQMVCLEYLVLITRANKFHINKIQIYDATKMQRQAPVIYQS